MHEVNGESSPCLTKGVCVKVVGGESFAEASKFLVCKRFIQLVTPKRDLLVIESEHCGNSVGRFRLVNPYSLCFQW